MSAKIIKNKWPQIAETTNDEERGDGIRSFKIQDGHASWKIKGMKCSKGIIFKIDSYSQYIFTLKQGVLSGKKTKVLRVSDSGVLSCHEGRFNLQNDLGENRTVRLTKLATYLPGAFL